VNTAQLDPIDRAFLARLAVPQAPVPAAPSVVLRRDLTPHPAARPHCPLPEPIVARLLAAAPEQWREIVDCVEQAHASGSRVFAITGARPGEGRTTLARGLVHLLRERGRSVVLTELPPAQMAVGDDPADRDAIVIVDAGIWFPGGPLRRGPLARLAYGCDAAVIVRRADRESCAAHADMLSVVGLQVLGEVVTFAQAPDRLVNEGI